MWFLDFMWSIIHFFEYENQSIIKMFAVENEIVTQNSQLNNLFQKTL